MNHFYSELHVVKFKYHKNQIIKNTKPVQKYLVTNNLKKKYYLASYLQYIITF